jgi:hypothetical protein
VERLAAHYVEDHLSSMSLRFWEKQTYVLVLPGSASASSPLNPRRLRCGDRRRRDRLPPFPDMVSGPVRALDHVDVG